MSIVGMTRWGMLLHSYFVGTAGGRQRCAITSHEEWLLWRCARTRRREYSSFCLQCWNEMPIPIGYSGILQSALGAYGTLQYVYERLCMVSPFSNHVCIKETQVP